MNKVYLNIDKIDSLELNYLKKSNLFFHEKKEDKWWKLFWLIPLFKISGYDEFWSYYEDPDISYVYKFTEKELIEEHSESVIFIDGIFYNKPFVLIISSNNKNIIYFNTNSELDKWVENTIIESKGTFKIIKNVKN